MQRSVWLTTALFALLPAAAWADAQIVIHTEPADVQVYVDGILKGDHTPLHVPSLAAGKHTVEVKKSGLVGELRNFEIGDGVTMPLEFKLVAEPPGSSAPKECNICPEMVNIPAGEFWIGSANGEPETDREEKPRHKIQVKEFMLGKYEITVEQFSAFMKESGYQKAQGCSRYDGKYQPDKNWREPGFAQDDKNPVVCVDAKDAQAYTDWLSHKTGHHYRLPNEAEWEYAARANTITPFYTGYCISTDQANYDGTGDDYNNCGAKTSVWIGKSQPVGFYPANPWGLYDMAGNAAEWTCSANTDSYDGSETKCALDADDRQLNFRVFRGGSWVSNPKRLRSADRGHYPSRFSVNNVGFRIARDE